MLLQRSSVLRLVVAPLPGAGKELERVVEVDLVLAESFGSEEEKEKEKKVRRREIVKEGRKGEREGGRRERRW